MRNQPAKITRAATIRDAYRACDLQPLSGDKLAWHVELAGARGVRERIAACLAMRERSQFVHIGFTGHRGCGKSTELRKLEADRRDELFVVYFEVTELLDPNDVSFTDLFIAITMKLAQAFSDGGMPLDQGILDSIESFGDSVVREATNSRDAQLGTSTEAGVGGEIPFVAKLKALFTSQYQASTQHKVTIRRVIERDITRLIDETNRLLSDARAKLAASCPNRDLLVVLDNLDRLPTDAAERLFFQHGAFLRQLQADIIFTVPVSVTYSVRGLANAFPAREMLPMVTIWQYERDRARLDWADAGLATMRSIVEARVDLEAVFDSPDLVSELARWSGGCPRHLVQLVRDACLSARADERGNVSRADVDGAIRHMQFDFERMIPVEHYPVLQGIARDKRAPSDALGQAVLFNLSALEYNGERRWNYVHPLLWRIERFLEGMDGDRDSEEARPAI